MWKYENMKSRALVFQKDIEAQRNRHTTVRKNIRLSQGDVR